MRYLTTAQIDAMSWRDAKLYFLEKYEEDAIRWECEHDDRRIFHNIYKNIVEALKSLPEEPHTWVKVAINDMISKERATLDDIQKHFEGR